MGTYFSCHGTQHKTRNPTREPFLLDKKIANKKRPLAKLPLRLAPPLHQSATRPMGKGCECRKSETVQLCRSWLETSEDPVRVTSSFAARLYRHWLDRRIARKSKSSDHGGNSSQKYQSLVAFTRRSRARNVQDGMYLDAAIKITRTVTWSSLSQRRRQAWSPSCFVVFFLWRKHYWLQTNE